MDCKLEDFLTCGGVEKKFKRRITDRCSGLQTSVTKEFKYNRTCTGNAGHDGNGDNDENGEDEDGNHY